MLCAFQMRALRHREVKSPAQGHTGQKWDLKPSGVASKVQSMSSSMFHIEKYEEQTEAVFRNIA